MLNEHLRSRSAERSVDLASAHEAEWGAVVERVHVGSGRDAVTSRCGPRGSGRCPSFRRPPIGGGPRRVDCRVPVQEDRGRGTENAREPHDVLGEQARPALKQPPQSLFAPLRLLGDLALRQVGTADEVPDILVERSIGVRSHEHVLPKNDRKFGQNDKEVRRSMTAEVIK